MLAFPVGRFDLNQVPKTKGCEPDTLLAEATSLAKSPTAYTIGSANCQEAEYGGCQAFVQLAANNVMIS